MQQKHLGFDPASISVLPIGFAQNACDQAVWTTATQAGRTRGVTAQHMRRAEIISQIMCNLEADFSAFPDALPYWKELASNGLVKLNDTRLTVPC